MTPTGALDHIMLPSGVMMTGATVRTLHSAITGKEITAHAESEAMSAVFTQELTRSNVKKRSATRNAVGSGGIFYSPRESAGDVFKIHDARIVAGLGHLVYLLKVIHLTVTNEGIVTNKELGQFI